MFVIIFIPVTIILFFVLTFLVPIIESITGSSFIAYWVVGVVSVPAGAFAALGIEWMIVNRF